MIQLSRDVIYSNAANPARIVYMGTWESLREAFADWDQFLWDAAMDCIVGSEYSDPHLDQKR